MILIHLILIRDFSHNSYPIFNTSNQKKMYDGMTIPDPLQFRNTTTYGPPVAPCKQWRAARTTGADSPSRCRLVPRTWIKVINNDCLASLLVPLLRDIYILLLACSPKGYVPGTRGINYEELNHFTSDIVFQVCLLICDKYWRVRGWWSSLSSFYVSTWIADKFEEVTPTWSPVQSLTKSTWSPVLLESWSEGLSC